MDEDEAIQAQREAHERTFGNPPAQPTIRLRIPVHILGAKAVDLDPRNALEMIRKDQKTLSGYEISLVAVLSERDAGMLLGMGKGHLVLMDPVEREEQIT